MGNSITVLTPEDWQDYELIDSGNGKKLERFGTYVMSRPDPRVLWQPDAPEDVWNHADAVYVRTSDTAGDWQIRTAPPKDWSISYHGLVFTLEPTAFKHVGVFPEQAPNWVWLKETINNRPLKVLNLFAYTGGATMAALSAGAQVTHVDASKPTIGWAKENVRVSGLSDRPVRWMLDDVYKFVQREGRRGITYDGIIMDPPRFGRGAKGEVWKLETDLPKLLAACKPILSPSASFFLLNAYTADISSLVLSHLVEDFIAKPGSFESGELALRDTAGGKLLPNGIFARWSRS